MCCAVNQGFQVVVRQENLVNILSKPSLSEISLLSG